MVAQGRRNKRRIGGVVRAVSLTILLTAAVCCWANNFTIAIDVAPNVLNIENQGEVVTVHTDLPYNSVVSASVCLNDVEIAWSKIDNCGNFVAKFVMEDIKDLPLAIGDYNTLTLTGMTHRRRYLHRRGEHSCDKRRAGRTEVIPRTRANPLKTRFAKALHRPLNHRRIR